MNNVLITQTAEYWLEKLEKLRIPCARVNNIPQAINDPQVRARNMVVNVEHPEGGVTEVPGNPIKLSETSGDSFLSPPLLGQHTDEVFEEWLGWSSQKLAEFLEEPHAQAQEAV